ncbi:Dabb family protein [Herbiconiux moechotypicola]|uniref:Dabb family protein n=1 Tax=Herbiconiux moechotypicola TaxID=637393 RepID=A0ABP5QWN3_9MICO|nr:Dabb family protein [Herbiconiux moechotypicola]MCS5730838.1 Dabb family protein [Herbiconiux moechotypicola]
MILHLAAFRWKDDVTDDDVAALTAALSEMAVGIPEIRSYTAGANLHLRPAGADYGVAAVLDDAAGLDAYLDHPAHLAVYEKHLGRMIAERSAVQLPIEEGSFR